MAGCAVGTWADAAALGFERPVEEVVLDARVVVEPLQMAQVGDRGSRVRVDVRGAVAGELQSGGFREGPRSARR